MPRAWFLRTAAAAVLSAVLVAGVSVLAPAPADAQSAKNLKILPSSMSRDDVKKLMKRIATSLGVQCEHCHDTDDFAKDGEKKEIARAMMKMTGDINKGFFKGEQKVTCLTCHNGKAEPKK
jgi:hypothetical protein